MPRSTSRATQATVDSVHRLVGKALARQLQAASRSKEPASAALIASAIAFLRLTGTDTAAQPRRRKDELAAYMPKFEDLDKGMQPKAPEGA